MTRIAIAGASLVLLIAACGGSGSDDPGAPDTPATPTTAAPTAPAPTAAPPTTATAPGVDAPVLAGTSWAVTTYTMTGGAFTGVLDGTEVTINFGTDGTLSGFTGCNNYTATFAVEGPYDEFEDGVRDENDGQAITIGPIEVTEIACESPGFIMEQEAEHLANLEGAERWFISRGNLVLRGENTLIEAAPTS